MDHGRAPNDTGHLTLISYSKIGLLATTEFIVFQLVL